MHNNHAKEMLIEACLWVRWQICLSLLCSTSSSVTTTSKVNDLQVLFYFDKDLLFEIFLLNSWHFQWHSHILSIKYMHIF